MSRGETVQVPAQPASFRAPPVARAELDARALARELAGETSAEVRFSPGSRALYATGGSNYRMTPIGVVVPRTIEDVVTAVAVCCAHGAPILNVGGHTSLAGQTVNTAVVIDFSKHLNRVLEVDPERKVARVQPGVVLDNLRMPARAEHGLTFGPDPSTHSHCTFGGMIGNNSCGVRSVQAQFYGPGPRMSDNLVGLEVLTYDGLRLEVGKTDDAELERIVGEGGRRGEIYAALRDLRDRTADLVRARYPQIPRRVSGYNLDSLLPENGFDVAAALTGTEGTCVSILEATVQLLDYPKARSLVVVGYEDACVAADHVPLVLEHRPLGLEGVDDVLVEDMALLDMNLKDLGLMPDGRGWLLVELGGETQAEANAKAHDLMRDLSKDGVPPTDMSLFADPGRQQELWKVREAGLGATAFMPGRPDAYEGWEDSAVPPERLGEYLRRLKQVLAAHGYRTALYGHYGQGCVHARINFDTKTREGQRTFRHFLEEASDLVVELGGSISGEHGDGQSKAELLPKMFGHELVGEFRAFKQIWDPEWKMNPGKVVDPYRITENLRYGTGYAPARVETHFRYPEDHGDFAHATTRCVGIGNCRRTDPEGGVMCPSYQVTREEKHSTRGRAHLLWEMLNNPEIELWRDDEVFEALDLCLSCKGCTHDCPVHVDLPTLKSEFLHHYYRGRPRPRTAYAFGLVDQAARLASHAPGLANALTQTPLAALAKRAVGIAPQRKLPPFAQQSLQAWFFARGERNPSGRRVLLWPDTFNNHFHAGVGVAAVEALEAAGYHVVMPEGHVCCGRPLYDYGMLDLAGRYLARTLDLLRDEVRAGTPIVGIEPSCVAVFRDELRKWRPNDEDGRRLADSVRHLPDLLAEADWEPPRLERKAVLHGHCHHKATGGIGPEQELLERMGMEVETTDSGCCGMAGSWGYEAAHYEVSQAVGERALLPAVREASQEAFIIADGFSCKTQIEQGGTARRALHIAEVIQLALRFGPAGPPAGPPERYVEPPPGAPPAGRRTAARAGAALGVTALAGAVLRRRR